MGGKGWFLSWLAIAMPILWNLNQIKQTTANINTTTTTTAFIRKNPWKVGSK
jgi:hypothetical protein